MYRIGTILKKKTLNNNYNTIDLKKFDFLQKPIVFNRFDPRKTLINKKSKMKTNETVLWLREHGRKPWPDPTRFEHRTRARRKNVRRSLFQCNRKEECCTIRYPRDFGMKIIGKNKNCHLPRGCILWTYVVDSCTKTTSSRQLVRTSATRIDRQWHTNPFVNAWRRVSPWIPTAFDLSAVKTMNIRYVAPVDTGRIRIYRAWNTLHEVDVDETKRLTG